MPIFDYKAIDSANKVKKGLVDADSPRDARIKLKREGLFVTDLVEARKRASRSGLRIRGVTGFEAPNKQRLEQVARSRDRWPRSCRQASPLPRPCA